MWNIKKSASSEEEVVATTSGNNRLMMNPYELTKRELMNKLKFFGIYIGAIVIVPRLLRALGVMAPLGIPLTRK